MRLIQPPRRVVAVDDLRRGRANAVRPTTARADPTTSASDDRVSLHVNAFARRGNARRGSVRKGRYRFGQSVSMSWSANSGNVVSGSPEGRDEATVRERPAADRASLRSAPPQLRGVVVYDDHARGAGRVVAEVCVHSPSPDAACSPGNR